MSQPIERPSNVAIARALCSLLIDTDELENYERDCLEETHNYLNEEPPNIQAAKSELADGVAHAFRARHKEDRPEAWLVAACDELLRNVK